MEQIDIKPTPQVLLALTHTDLKPIDALCELVDNAIDSFAETGNQSGINEIHIDLPTLGELQKDEGKIRIMDNGPGMTLDNVKKALTAGYSSQNAYGRLGMFGMGLNIATGKFARKTRLVTATKESDMALVVEVDLEKLVEQGHFGVQPMEENKNNFFPDSESGTIIELSSWWREGNPNRDNPVKLVRNGPGRVSQILGRRYATLLRSDLPVQFSIWVKNEKCIPFEHCVWAEHRFVTRGNERIPARQVFDTVLNTQVRCLECGELASPNGQCTVDTSHPTGSIEERVRGWIGVQRYDDVNNFGIDLIRNGRAIRILEQDAFFSFETEDGEIIKDYVVDGIHGRIVGEVHLDHVRVDFTKQDFQRYTPEWVRAMEFLRGKSSLQSKRPGAADNHSPVMKIYRGYRRVRSIGLVDMYMGERQEGDKGPSRVSRELEKEYLERFRNKEEGYYDDAKWWEKVEEASRERDEFVQCPECEFQNPANAETCSGCERLLKSKDCIHCGEKIPQSAVECKHCGKPQIPEGPWHCAICGHKNSPEEEECIKCGHAKGAVNVFSQDYLVRNSSKDEDLSVKDVEINLPDGTKSSKFDLEVRITSLKSGNLHLPSVVYTDLSSRNLQIFLDKSHSVFLSLQLCPEHAVAMESATLIKSESNAMSPESQKYQYSLVSLQERVLDKYWKKNLSDDAEEVRGDMHHLLDDVRSKMAENMVDIAEDVFNNMTASERTSLLSNLQEAGEDISEMKRLKESGRFFVHVPPETVVSVFRVHTGRFFDKIVWESPWSIPDMPDENVRAVQKQIKETYLNCLEDGVGFLHYRKPKLTVIRRARLSIEFLKHGMVG